MSADDGKGMEMPPDPITTDDCAMVADLVDTLVDGIRGYRTAADQADDEELVAVLRDLGSGGRQVTVRLIQVSADAGITFDADLDGTTTDLVIGRALRNEGKALGLTLGEALGATRPVETH